MRQRRIGKVFRQISRPPRRDAVRHGFAASRAKRMHHFQYAVTASGAKVYRQHTGLLAQRIKRRKMPARQIHHVYGM